MDQKQLNRVLEFFDPENLKKLSIRYKEDVALLVIDVQKEFSDPDSPFMNGTAQTKAIAERIGALVPEFRKAGIPVYAIYYPPGGKIDMDPIDFYKFDPATNDVIVSKWTDSAFQSGRLKKALRDDGRKLLLTCGFNLSACVERTINDARAEGYSVCLLQDMSGNGDCTDEVYLRRETLRNLNVKGVVVANSEQVLPALQRAFKLSENQLPCL